MKSFSLAVLLLSSSLSSAALAVPLQDQAESVVTRLTGDHGSASVKKVASFDHQVTGVAVSETGRIFMSFPRWSRTRRSRSPNSCRTAA